MNYTTKYLKSKGQDCLIPRPMIGTAVGLGELFDPGYKYPTKISLKRATTAIRIYGARESHWEGLILPDSGLISGEVFEANNMTFLTQSVNIDPASNVLTWFAVTVNAMLEHWRSTETVDANYHIIEEWTKKGDVPAYGEIVTAELRQRDIGLLEGTLYIFQIPKNADVQLLDRIIYEGKNYQVNSLDSAAMPGITRLQCGADQRPDAIEKEPENGNGNGDDNGDDEEIED